MADSRIVDLPSKGTPAGTDITNILDAASGNDDKKVTLADLPISSATQTALNAKQASLGFTPENVANKENTTLDTSTTKYPTNNLVKTYVDAGLAGKQNTIGFTPENVANKAINLTSPDNTKYPTTQAVSSALSGKQDSLGFTPENVANKENTTLDTSATKYPTNNLVKAYVDTGLSGKQNTIGFTPEDVANKSTNTSLGTSDTLYPSQNAVKVYADTKIAKAAGATYTVNNVLAVTAAEYAAIATPDANTVYFIV